MFHEYPDMNLVLLGPDVELLYSIRRVDPNQFHISSSPILVDHVAMAVQKDSPLLPILDDK